MKMSNALQTMAENLRPLPAPGGIGFTFVDDDEPVDHSNEPTQFPCNYCSHVFVTRASLARHMVYHEDEIEEECYAESNGHEQIQEQEQPTTNNVKKVESDLQVCLMCQQNFANKSELTQHVLTSHGGARFQCSLCRRNVSRRDHLKRHIKNVHGVKNPVELDTVVANSTFQFNPSDYTNSDSGEPDVEFNSMLEEDSLNYENNDNSTFQMTVEPEMPQLFDDADHDEDQDMMLQQESQALPTRKHGSTANALKIIDVSKPVKVSIVTCELCQLNFASVMQLQKHMATHSEPDRPHKCHLCSKTFLRKEHLTKHMSSVHSGMKFTCEFCGKDISRKDHLIRHIRNVHPTEYLAIPHELTQETTNEIPIWTLEASGALSEKAISSLQPKPKKPFMTCDMCPQNFFTMDELYTHQTAAHGDVRKHKCLYCPKSFKRREHLLKHEVLHTGVKKFNCDFCTKKFPRKDALNDHIRRLHADILVADGASGSIVSESAIEYPCSLGCSDVFASSKTLGVHLRNVHGVSLNNDDESNPSLEYGGHYLDFMNSNANGSQNTSGYEDNDDEAEMPDLPLSISMNMETE